LGVQRQNALRLRPILRLIVVAFVLFGVTVIVVVFVLAFVLVFAELVLDYLVCMVLVVLGDPPVGLISVVMVAPVVLAKDADLPVLAFVLVLAASTPKRAPSSSARSASKRSHNSSSVMRLASGMRSSSTTNERSRTSLGRLAR
jgi:hypothetical protein